MVVIQSLVIAWAIVHFGGKALKKRPSAFYAAAWVLSAGAVAGTWSGAFGHWPLWCGRYVVPIFTRGALAGALFWFVMMANAVPNGSAFMRGIMPIRGELSILASILAIGHGVTLLKGQLAHLATGSSMIGFIVSLALMAIMLPLFALSFRRVRRQMPARRWKRIQRCAYGFYLLLLAHILVFNIPKAVNGTLGARINVIVYSLLIIGYGALRIEKALARKRREWVSLPVVFGVLAYVVILLAVFCPAMMNRSFASLAEMDEMRATLEQLQAENQALEAKYEQLSSPLDAPGENAVQEQLAPETASDDSPDAAGAARYQDGKYSGADLGYNGRLTVSVVIEGGTISSIKLTGTVDDDEYVDDVEATLLPAMIEKQSAEVDAVSGATSTSDGVIAAVREALAKAEEISQ